MWEIIACSFVLSWFDYRFRHCPAKERRVENMYVVEVVISSERQLLFLLGLAESQPRAIRDFKRHIKGQRYSRIGELNCKSGILTIILKLWRTVCVCVCVHERRYGHTASYWLSQSSSSETQSAQLLDLKSIFSNDHKNHFLLCPQALSRAEHQPAGTVSWS